MRKLILVLALASLGSNAVAQSYTVQQPTNPAVREQTKFYISPSYGGLFMANFAALRANLTIGYSLTSDLRVSAVGGWAFGESADVFSGSLLIGSTELYTSPYSKSYSEISFGVGYTSYPDVSGGMVYFPIRYRWGIGITKNIAVGLECMLALTTKRSSILMGDIGLFCALKF